MSRASTMMVGPVAVPLHFPGMVQAELRAVFGRTSGWLLLAVSALIGVVALVAFAWMQHKVDSAGDTAPVINGMPITALLEFSAQMTGGWALRARNFFILPILLLLATAGTVAGELSERSMREVCVRPVPRWSVLAAKVCALVVLSLLSHLLTLAPSLGGGAVALGTESPVAFSSVLLGYGASMLSDLGVIALGVVVSLWVHNVGMVVVATLLFLIGDLALQGLFWGLDKLGVAWAANVGQLMPGKALSCWEGWSEGWMWEQFAGMAVLLLVTCVVGVVRMERMDVP